MEPLNDTMKVSITTIPTEISQLSHLLEERPESLAIGSNEIKNTALNATKYIFDLSVESETSSHPHIGELISSLMPSNAPQTRSKTKNAAELAAGSSAQKDLLKFTPLKSLFVDGMDEEQIWAQLDLRTKAVCRMLDYVLEGISDEQDEEEDEDEDEDSEDIDEMSKASEKLRKALEAIESGEDLDMDELMTKYGLDEEDMNVLVNLEIEEEEQDRSEAEEDSSIDEEGEEEVFPLRDVEMDEPSKFVSKASGSRVLRTKKKGSKFFELDDGFFDLDEFNAETERAESKSSSRGRLAGDDDSDEDNMDIDLFAPVDDDEDMEADGSEAENELFYRDFFEPPSRSQRSPAPAKGKKAVEKTQVRFNDQVRIKKIKATGKNRSLHDDSDEDEENDDDGGLLDAAGVFNEDEEEEGEYSEFEENEEDSDMDGSKQGTESESEDEFEDSNAGTSIQRMKQDLFADDEEEVDRNMTTHERRMATLKGEIAELESENVAPKEWVLMGEAGSRQRPQNSLLEEDLEFERVMKAVPVTTEESVKTLEEKIKARILAGQFDDVIRIRPLEDKPFLPSKLFELKDAKSSRSLAQIYEDEYVASQTGGTTDDRDGKLKKEHDDISALWEGICSKLDALCNAHYTPKQPKAIITTVSNVATATLESALPTSKSASTMLAPEEVFAASPSLPRANSEMSPAEKRALRTKERKSKKRQRDALEKSVDKFAKKGLGSVKKQKQVALDSIVKHGKGVTVVGKKSAATSQKRQKK